MGAKEIFINIWKFLKEDSWQSWIVSIILIIIGIKFIFFPFLSFITGTELPLVVVESCSMYHGSSFPEWWQLNSEWYESRDIAKSDFSAFPFRSGLNKGDIVFVYGRSGYELGDVIVFRQNTEALSPYPIIHRIIQTGTIGTKGDNNNAQLTINNNPQRLDETSIIPQRIMGKALFKIPLLGWVKLIFFDALKPEDERGFCQPNIRDEISVSTRPQN